MNVPTFSETDARKVLAFHRSSGDLFGCRMVELMLALHSMDDTVEVTTWVAEDGSGFMTDIVNRRAFLTSTYSN